MTAAEALALLDLRDDFDPGFPSVHEDATGARDRSPVPDDEPEPADELRWQRSYRRDDVDRFIAEVEAEKARLLMEIAAVEERIARARATVSRSADAEAALGLVVLGILREQEELERAHEAAVEHIRATAAEESERRLADAKREVGEVRRTIDTLVALVRSEAAANEPADDDRPCGSPS